MPRRFQRALIVAKFRVARQARPVKREPSQRQVLQSILDCVIRPMTPVTTEKPTKIMAARITVHIPPHIESMKGWISRYRGRSRGERYEGGHGGSGGHNPIYKDVRRGRARD